MNKYAAVDLGASNGRIIVGNLQEIEVVHRFPSRSVKVNGSYFWDILGIFIEIKTGLKKAFQRYPGQIKSIGIDTWGVDFALFDKRGNLIGNPYHYRDGRTDGIMEEVFGIIPREEIYNETGIQFMQLNTLFQLYAYMKSEPDAVRNGCFFLTIPDILNYWLTGVMKNEFSIVTTTQLYNPVKRDWAWGLIDKLGFDKNIFQEVVPSGTVLGSLLPDIAAEIGAGPDIAVTAVACHDTGSAVAAVPAGADTRFAFLSSGTWSLLGVEIEQPLITRKTLEENFTNEGAAGGGIRFLKNIMGLWILQECKREWELRGIEMTYDQLEEEAEQSGPAPFYIDPNNTDFLKPGVAGNTMPDRVGRGRTDSPAVITRIIFESLARCYTENLRKIEDISGEKIDVLHIIGGGSRNQLLNKLTSDISGIPVTAGPAEATAIGNILVQSITHGEVTSIDEGRKIIAASLLSY